MGSCAAPSAKGDDKFITTDYLQQCPISCPSCSATDGVVRNGKSTAGHQRYLCSHCRKTWQL
ncbi:hypothetical protein NOI56_26485, partial [Escherichia coli]|uniref:IS1 family transposase n=1 Tax=Escherichia coli TaxID=562 RepID=UPI002876AFF4